MPEVELVLVNGERRRIVLPSHTGTSAHALDRLDDWMATVDGGWVQKKFIVEVRPVPDQSQTDDSAPSRE